MLPLDLAKKIDAEFLRPRKTFKWQDVSAHYTLGQGDYMTVQSALQLLRRRGRIKWNRGADRWETQCR